VPQNLGRSKKKMVTLVKRTQKSEQVKFHREENAYMERTCLRQAQNRNITQKQMEKKKAATRKEKERNSRLLEKGGR